MSSTRPPAASARSQRAAILSIAAFVLVAGVITGRTVRDLNVLGRPELSNGGLIDLRDMFYYPAVSLLEGNNPYDVARFSHYPVSRTGLPYPPQGLLLHVPLGLLSQRLAETLHFSANLLLSLLLAYLTVRLCDMEIDTARIFTVAFLLLLSRPGQMTLFAGQCTFYVVAGCYAALLYARERPWLAAVGLAIASMKPTFVVPLGFLLLARGDWRAVVAGAALTLGLLVVATAVFVGPAGGLMPLVHSFAGSYAQFRLDPATQENLSVNRIDAAAIIGRLFGGSLGPIGEIATAATIVGLAALAVTKVSRDHDASAQRVSSILICLAILTCSYHQAYDALILALPAAALVWNRTGALLTPRAYLARWVLLGLIVVPAINYLASHTANAVLQLDGPIWALLTSANRAAVLAAFLIIVTLALWPPPTSPAGVAGDARPHTGPRRPNSLEGVAHCADSAPDLSTS